MTQRQILIFALGPLGAALLSFLTLPILTWFVSIEDVGRVAMLQVVITFSFVVSSFGLDQAFVREYYDVQNKGVLFKSAFLPGFVFVSLATALGLVFFRESALEYFSLSSGHLVYVVVGCVLINFVNTFLSHALRMSGNAIGYSFSLLLPKAVFLFCILVGVFANYPASFGFLLVSQGVALFFTSALLLFLTRELIAKAYSSKFSTKISRQLLSFGLPLVFGSIAYWALTMFDRIALGWWSNLSELGVYSVGISFAAVGILFQSIFSVVWSPIVYKWASQGADLSKVDAVSEHVTAFVVFSFMMIGLSSFVVSYFLPHEYDAVKYIVGACLGLPLLYTLSEITVIGAHLKRKTLLVTLAPICALPTNILLAYLLIPLYGAAGAAVSTSIAMFVFLLLRTEVSIRTWRKFRRVKMYIFVGGCLIISSFQALHGEEFEFFLRCGWSILGVAMLFSFRKSFKALQIFVCSKFLVAKEN